MREESGGGKEAGKKDERKETAETAPSQQSDLLRSIGEKFRGATLPTTATFALTWGQYLKGGSRGRKQRNSPMVDDYGKR